MIRIALVVAGAVLVAGCADGQDAAVRQGVDAFAEALREGDPAAACEVLAPLTREELESSQQADCPEALDAQDLLRPSVVGPVERFGRQARVMVEDEEGDSDVWFLSRFDGGWLVVASGCAPRGGSLPYQCDVEGA